MIKVQTLQVAGVIFFALVVCASLLGIFLRPDNIATFAALFAISAAVIVIFTPSQVKSFSFGADAAGPDASKKRYLVIFFDASTMNPAEQAQARQAAANSGWHPALPGPAPGPAGKS